MKKNKFDMTVIDNGQQRRYLFSRNGVPKFDVTMVHEGQYRAYGDSYYEYDIAPLDGQSEEEVWDICQELQPSLKPNVAHEWYECYTTKFHKHSNNSGAYRYEACRPYTD